MENQNGGAMSDIRSTQARADTPGDVLLEALRGSATHELVESRGVRIGLGIAAFVVVTALSAYVVVPWTPVPMTLQPLAVLLAGALLGPWAGAGAMATYLAVGAAGLPVFSAGHAGLPWLMGPTGGYLLAFPAAALVVGLLAGDGSSPRSSVLHTARVLLALFAGLAVLYLGGVTQLRILTGEGLGSLLAVGVLPFLLGDVTKVLIALFVVLAVRRTREARSPGGL